MSHVLTLLHAALNAALALLLAPLAEGAMRKLRARIHSRVGPPLIQPYLDLLKLLGKEDLRPALGAGGATGPGAGNPVAGGAVYGAAPALALGSALMLATLVPMGAAPPLGFAGDILVLVYVSSIGAVVVMLTAFASASPYASVGGSREMMLLLAVEPVLVGALAIGAVKAGTLATGGIAAWHAEHGPAISMVMAGIGLLLALQAQAGKLPFDIAEADQELMGGPLVEQSGPRLALFRWSMWVKQLVFAFLLVEVFAPWPRVGLLPVDLVLAAVEVAVVLVVVALVDVVNPRLRVEQALAYFVRVGVAVLAALAFAVVGL
jgi:formate hydrogenlyase subunit 4